MRWIRRLGREGVKRTRTKMRQKDPKQEEKYSGVKEGGCKE